MIWIIEESFYYVNYELSIITSKHSSKSSKENLSNQNTCDDIKKIIHL